MTDPPRHGQSAPACNPVRVVYDGACELGEGPLWHPALGCLFWFDINAGILHRCGADGAGHRQWALGERASACAWIDRGSLLVATASALARFDLGSGRHENLVGLEHDQPLNRANDGRTDRHGAFWVGTMALAEGRRPGAGALYRLRQGRLEKMLDDLTIPNAIAFAPDARHMYFSDSHRGLIWRWELDPRGDPRGEPRVFADLRDSGGAPDGAVCDRDGYLWNAQWGNARLVRYTPAGALDRVVAAPVSCPTCPALGGEDFTTLFFTSAYEGMSAAARAAEPRAGATFAFPVEVPGLPEVAYRP